MYYVIVNPASKSGRGRQIWVKLEKILEEKEIPYKVIFSKGIGHVTRVVAKLTAPLADDPAAAPIKLIILGGDGTMNEALQGISDFDRVWLGYIPTGSSNDLSRDLQLPKDPVLILSSIMEGKIVRTMDLGMLTYNNPPGEFSRLHVEEIAPVRYFSVSSGIGFDAAVCEEALASRFKNILNKLKLGKLTYLILALKQLIAAKSVSCDIYLDDSPEPIHLNSFLFTAFMIHKYEGGGFKFCPAADATDGMLDLCVVGNIPKTVIFFALPTAFFGKHYMFSQIKHYTASKARFVASMPLWVHTDGEVYAKSDNITIACISRKVKLMM
ncbi:MAG: diacylglycerol kinase family lipid kinase [Clostridiales bacterium]|nr:diacylglycerol kinase family lipid kinase [Clostridiales bacterium]